MGKRRPAEADLSDQDPNAMRGNALGGKNVAFPGLGKGGMGTFGTAATGVASGADGGDARGALMLHHMKALNEQFATWVGDQLSAKPLELWISGVQDYLDHADGVEKSFQDVLDGKVASKPPLSARVEFPPPTSGPSFGPAPSRVVKHKPDEPDSSAGPTKSPFAGISLTAPAAAPATASFSLTAPAAAPATASLFPTSTTPPAFGASTSGSLFGGSAPSLFGSTGSAPSLFGATALGAGQPLTFNLNSAANPFAAPGTLTIPTPAAGNDDDGVEPPPSPTKVERSGDEEILVESQAKMFFKSGNEWKDMGVGTLSLRKNNKLEAGEKQLVRLVMCNKGGKFTLNANLYKGMKVQLVNKQPKQLSLALFNAEAKTEEAQKTATLTMLRFGKEPTANNFKELIEANAPN